MKKTKNMVFTQTPEADELYLYTINDGDLYRNVTMPIINNLSKKYIKGIYDKEKAQILYYRLAAMGAKKYSEEFNTDRVCFRVTERWTVAVWLEVRYKDLVIEMSKK